MKNLLLLMMTILLVNVSVQANIDEKEAGESETKCTYMNGEGIKDLDGETTQDGSSNEGSAIRV